MFFESQTVKYLCSQPVFTAQTSLTHTGHFQVTLLIESSTVTLLVDKNSCQIECLLTFRITVSGERPTAATVGVRTEYDFYCDKCRK